MEFCLLIHNWLHGKGHGVIKLTLMVAGFEELTTLTSRFGQQTLFDTAVVYYYYCFILYFCIPHSICTLFHLLIVVIVVTTR